MKILLIGEMSGVHITLRNALNVLGHDVTLVSNGDFWRKRKADVLLKPMTNRLNEVINYFYNKKVLKDLLSERYDVVQLIHPTTISPLFSNLYLSLLSKHKYFVINAGDDIFNYYDENFKDYYENIRVYDNMSSDSLQFTHKLFDLQKQIYENSHGLIPVNHIYYNSCIKSQYNTNLKIFEPVFLPFEISHEKDNMRAKNDNNFYFWHGINRVGAKGSLFFQEAFKKSQEKYPHYQFMVNGRLPYDEYLKVMSKTDVYADQVYFAEGYGYATIIALSQGKSVLGADGKTIMKLLNLDYELPIFRATNDPEQIAQQIDFIIENKHQYSQWSKNAIHFVNQFHNSLNIAKQFISIWEA